MARLIMKVVSEAPFDAQSEFFPEAAISIDRTTGEEETLPLASTLAAMGIRRENGAVTAVKR